MKHTMNHAYETESLIEFLSTRISEDRAKTVTNEKTGIALSLLLDSNKNDDKSLIEWASKIDDPEFGYVYIFLGVYKGLRRYKIGKAQSIKDRRSIFSVKLPFDIDLVAAFRVKEACKAERAIHKSQAANRVGGEWFDLNESSFDAVCRLGISMELSSLSESITRKIDEYNDKRVICDKEYISALEGLLAMNGIKFSREDMNGP